MFEQARGGCGRAQQRADVVGAVGPQHDQRQAVVGLQRGAGKAAAQRVQRVQVAQQQVVVAGDMRLRGLGLLTGWVKFTLICGIGAISNVGIASMIYAYNGNWAFAAGLAGAIVGGFWNFMVSAILVWRLR